MAAEQNARIQETVQQERKRLLNFIRKRVTNVADAEDILQDVLYQFTEYSKVGKHIDSITAWLFTVTRNKITDKQRKHKPELLGDVYSDAEGETTFDWTDLFSDGSNNPETEYLRNLFWEALHAALNELPKAQRDVFILNEIEGVPFKTIAEQTGETINTLLSRKRYAVLHLRERLSVLRDELLHN